MDSICLTNIDCCLGPNITLMAVGLAGLYTLRTSVTEKVVLTDLPDQNIINFSNMNNCPMTKPQQNNLFTLTKETQEYHSSEKSRSVANLEELLFHATRYRKCGDVLPLKNLCVRLRHPLKSLNNSRLDWMVNEIERRLTKIEQTNIKKSTRIKERILN